VSQPVLSPQSALVYLMVIVAAADSRMTDAEIGTIYNSVADLPVFRAYDQGRLRSVAEDCAAILQEADGLNTVLGLVHQALPEDLRDTGYAIACTVAISDGGAGQEELRLLELIRAALGLDRLIAAAVERGVAALHRPVPA
jgi:tellurite resistance protein